MLHDDYVGSFVPELGLADLSRGLLARLGREWLLIGHLQDRVGMPLVLARHSPDEMAQVAIEEWMGASPIYSARVQRALRFGPAVGERNVATIFKNIKLDIGAPHQFLDFRFAVTDDHHGEFWLDHCGALMDAEPMGEDYVRRMCHDIEDPTFDATAAAVHPCARIRPIHRPPRQPADRLPHCHWTVVIDEDQAPYEQHPNLALVGDSLIANIGLVDPGHSLGPGGWDDLAGDRDVNFELEDLSQRALVLGLQEVAVQTHLLARAFLTCVAQRWGDEEAAEHGPGVFTGIAGIGAERIRDALSLGGREAGATELAKVLQLHPIFFPRTYVDPRIDVVDDTTVRFALGDAPCFAERDRSTWFAAFDDDASACRVLEAIAFAIDPRCRATRVSHRGDERHAFSIELGPPIEPTDQDGCVSLAKISTGANVTFLSPRRTGLSPRRTGN